MKKVLLLITHLLAAALGFAGGIYALPILTAPPAPSAAELESAALGAEFSGTFKRNLAGSDALHWGEGEVSIGPQAISFSGKLAPGPDYKLYLSPVFVEDETGFAQHRAQMNGVGDVRTFDGFVVDLPPGIDPGEYSCVIVWCESFGEFITSARYR